MTYYTDQELEAATDAVIANIMAGLAISGGLSQMALRDFLFGIVQRECANALTAAAKVRSQRPAQ